MNDQAIIEDQIQPMPRAVTRKIERHGVAPDEQTIRVKSSESSAPTLPRAELIRLMTRNYEARRAWF